MKHIYKDKFTALCEAKKAHRWFGGVIFQDITEELTDDYGRIIGTFGAVVLGTGKGAEPFGDSHRCFYYEL